MSHNAQEDQRCAALILAAGSSSRMGAGRHKLQLPLGNHAVLTHVVTTALASQARPVMVVLGHQAEEMHALLPTSDKTLMSVINPDYQLGMSSSIRVGLQALIAHAKISAALILLGDQPLLTTQIIDTLIAARHTTGKQIIAPLYEGQRGSPVLFDARLFTELLHITGDQGGRSVIAQHRAELVEIEMGNKTASFDVDTWEAYQQVVQEWQKK